MAFKFHLRWLIIHNLVDVSLQVKAIITTDRRAGGSGISARPFPRTPSPESSAASSIPFPIVTIAAQHTALNAPGLLPAIVGEKYSPPGQSAAVKY
jgi:hypothetical protein